MNLPFFLSSDAFFTNYTLSARSYLSPDISQLSCISGRRALLDLIAHYFMGVEPAREMKHVDQTVRLLSGPVPYSVARGLIVAVTP